MIPDWATLIICFLISGGLIYWLYRLSHQTHPPGPAWEIEINNSHFKTKGLIKMTSFKYHQKVAVTLTPLDTAGNPAPVEAGSVTVSSSNPEMGEIVRDPNNELIFELQGRSPGVIQVDFSADADRGSGVETITGFFGAEILPGTATGFGVSIGDPTEQ